MRFEAAAPEDITILSLDGDVLDGARPSSETRLHLGIYERSSAQAVVHTHGRSSVAVGLVCDRMPWCTTTSCDWAVAFPPCRTTSSGLTNLPGAVGAAIAEGFGTVLMRNHGAVSSARSVEEAVEHAALLEWLCDVYLAARTLGTPELLTDDDLVAVAAQSARLSYGH